ncbi:acyltransferase family protein [Rubrivivax sp. A210]|uniref:acyltransferase family protein n=1 Tax=Rubrivivax sp. A210 TaxID=2772301 RepID=UPI0019194B4F|nr:acyltransferase [Rubrivivax sp. A210]
MSKSIYIPALDGLRAVAVIAVVALHGAPTYLTGGFIGVDMFFVISGFLITLLCCQEFAAHGNFDFGKFYLRRAIRLWPALFLMLVVVVFIHGALSPAAASNDLVDAGVALVYLSNWQRAFHWTPDSIFGHTWSLSIEEQFYLIWPPMLAGLFILARKLNKSTSLAIAVAALTLAFCVMIWRAKYILLNTNIEAADRLYNGLDGHSDGLLLGCALGALYAKGALRLISGYFGAAAGALLLLSIFVLREHHLWMIVAGYAVVATASTLIVWHIVTNQQGVASRLLSQRGIVFIGRISYGIYLWHYPIFWMFREAHVPKALLATAGVFLSLVAAWASFVFVEQPLSQRLRPFAVRRGPT